MIKLIEVKQRAYADIEARYACAHQHRELRVRTIADGRQTLVNQCVRCGNTSLPIARATARSLSKKTPIPPHNDNLEPQWRAQKSAEYQKVFEKLAPALAAEYESYLRSDVWRERRSAVLTRASNLCELCEKARAANVHHLTYVRLGNELLSDLLAVCESCHAILHASDAAQQPRTLERLQQASPPSAGS